jgi:hypothetical protein
MLKVRFKDYPRDATWDCFVELINSATGEEVTVVQDLNVMVDLEITGPYGGTSDDYKTPLFKRLNRMAYVTFTHGKHLKSRRLSTGVQPSKKARKNLWYSGENVRPPQGEWDLYLGFDNNLDPERSIYFPLWYLTSTDLFACTKKTYWGFEVPTIEQLLEPRVFKHKKKKFSAAFIGKSYPMRLHVIEALSKIGNIDVYGTSVRRRVDDPSKIAPNYRFILCLENDVYPGYVTEKPFEAYLSGAIPLYFGIDNLGFLNQESMINLSSYPNIIDWSSRVGEVAESIDEYKFIYEQPLLNRSPTLDLVKIKIKEILN